MASLQHGNGRITPKRLAWAALNSVRRIRGRIASRRLVNTAFDRPVVSFTFDDIPHAAVNGGTMLAQADCRGTFYVSAGLMDKTYELGQGFSEDDLRVLHEQGHEIGCHTFGHLNAWHIGRERFSITLSRNRDALSDILPGILLKSFSYPFGSVTPVVKRIAGTQFTSARGIEWGINAGTIDLNLLKAYPLYTDAPDAPDFDRVFREMMSHNGWLILYTHDVADSPTPYGCSTAQFGKMIERVLSTGAHVLPVGDVVELMARSTAGTQTVSA